MDFDPYETWLGIPADRRPPTYYDLLGLAPYESDPAAIDQAALRRMSKVRQHQIGPHSDLSQEVLAELARARLILMDPDRRAEYDAKIRSRGAGSRGPSPEPTRIASGNAASGLPRPGAGVPDVLGSLVLADDKTDGPSTVRPDSMEATSPWKGRLLIGAIVAGHALLLWVGYAFLFSPSNAKRKAPDTVRNSSSTQTPTPKPLGREDEPAVSRTGEVEVTGHTGRGPGHAPVREKGGVSVSGRGTSSRAH